MRVPFREQTPSASLDHQYSYADSLTLWALIRTAAGKQGGRNTETEASMRAWLESHFGGVHAVMPVLIQHTQDTTYYATY